jgi:hypothetical protein
MPWNESLYWWLAYSALVSLVVLAVGSGAALLCRQPARRLRIIELSLAGCLVAPLLGLVPGYPHMGIAWRRAGPPQPQTIPTPPATVPAVVPVLSEPDIGPPLVSELPSETIAEPADMPARGWDVGSWFVGLYLLGVAIGIAWWLLGMTALVRIIWTAQAAPPRCRQLLAEIAGRRNARVRLLTSRLAKQPFASVGVAVQLPPQRAAWRRAVIVLPESLCDDEQAVRWALAHEWTHIEHGDFRAWFVAGLARVLFFYQPLVWWLRRQLRLCQDFVADARASRQASQPEDYAEFLTARAAAGLLHPAMVGLGMGFSKSELYRRVVMLVQNRPLESRPPRLWSISVTCVALILVAVAAALTSAPRAAAQSATGSASAASPDNAQQPDTSQPGSGGASGTPRNSPHFTVERRAINKRAKDFPARTDLSAPESAMAALCQKWTQGGITSALAVSWIQLDAEIAKEIESALRNDPSGPKIDLRQMFGDVEIIDVVTYHDDLAVVTYKENLHTERPYGGVLFGKINGAWKSLCLGMPMDDSAPSFDMSFSSIQAVTKRFESGRDDLWQRFVRLRNDVLNGHTPSLLGMMGDSIAARSPGVKASPSTAGNTGGATGTTPDKTNDKPQAPKPAKAKITLQSLGFTTAESGPGNDEETEKLIKEKKYKFVKTFDSGGGGKQYVYHFIYPDGREVNRNFSMPLDNVSSWADYEAKRKLQKEQRNERISQALTSGRFRLLDLEVMQIHICRDVASGTDFKVQRIQRRDHTEIALPRVDFGKIPPSVHETSWQEHLDAIRDGKRQLLKLETVNDYTYEMTADDGAKEIFSYGGNEPLEALVKRSVNPFSSRGLFTMTTKSSVPAKPGAPEGVTERLHGVRPQGNCSLSGKLVSESTGKPIAGATMYLFYLKTYSSIFVHTDNDGTFVFKDIPKGPFSLRSIHKAGYQDTAYNPEGMPKEHPFPEFTLRGGEQRSGILLKAKDACRVAGVVRDEDGNIPSDAKRMSVCAWFKTDKGQKYSLAHGMVEPDGSYVIDGLDNKPVYVMATSWETQKQGEGYPAIYAPSTFFRGDAKLITFDKSHQVDGVNITLQKTGGLTLEGTVRDDRGNPVPEALVVVHHRDMLFDRVTTYSDAQGHYEVHGLGDGEVLVHVDAIHRGLVRTRAPIALERKTPRMRRDFILHRGALISGKLVDEDGNAWQIGSSHGEAHSTVGSKGPKGTSSWSGLPNKHAVQSVRESGAVFYMPGEGDYDCSDMVFPTSTTFIFQSMRPGHTRIRFSPQAEGQKVIRILHDGRDIMKSGLDTKAGEEIKDITIVIGPVSATGAVGVVPSGDTHGDSKSPPGGGRPAGQR